MPRSFDQALAELATTQFGLFTRQQAVEFGATSDVVLNRLQHGRWSAVHPGVFAISGSPPWSERALLAACLLGGDGTLVARRAAAWLWNLPGAAGAPGGGVEPAMAARPVGRYPRSREQADR